MQDGAAALGADALARTDLVMIDERAWKNLDAATKRALEDAARDGLGLFLRVSGALPDTVANEWRELGFRVRSDGGVDNCTVVGTSGYDAIDAATCRLVEQRFRFRPALDTAGRPVDYNLRTDFTWWPR